LGGGALKGLRIGVYEHSSVARDAMVEALSSMGAEVVRLARADHFIPVDTEAVDAETREMLKGWCSMHGLDALVSTDGDADRPMVVDASGTLVPGDVLGPLVAQSEAATLPLPQRGHISLPASIHPIMRPELTCRITLCQLTPPMPCRCG